MGVDRISEFGDRTSEGQAAGVYWTDFTAGSLARVYIYYITWPSVRIKIEITFIFRFHRQPIQLVVFVPVGLFSFLRHLLQV